MRIITHSPVRKIPTEELLWLNGFTEHGYECDCPSCANCLPGGELQYVADVPFPPEPERPTRLQELGFRFVVGMSVVFMAAFIYFASGVVR